MLKGTKVPELILALAVVTLIAMVLSSNVEAHDGAYVGIAYQDGNYSEGHESVSPEVATLTLGTQLHDNLDLEVQFGMGLSDGSLHHGPYRFDVGVDNMVSVLLRPNIDFGGKYDDLVSLHGIVGVTRGKFEGKMLKNGVVLDQGHSTETDLSLGLGVDVHITHRVRLTVDHIRYIEKNGGEYKGTSLGLKLDL